MTNYIRITDERTLENLDHDINRVRRVYREFRMHTPSGYYTFYRVWSERYGRMYAVRQDQCVAV